MRNDSWHRLTACNSAFFLTGLRRGFALPRASLPQDLETVALISSDASVRGTGAECSFWKCSALLPHKRQKKEASLRAASA
jgi:hypothetical protein